MAEEVMLRSRLLCCICAKRGDQIHHIDGNAANNNLNNLAFLCYKHHHEATVTGGLNRRLSPTLLRKFRDEWYAKVKSERAPLLPSSGAEERQLSLITDAVLRIEVERLWFRFEAVDWGEVESILSELRVFQRLAGYRARLNVIELLAHIASRTRFRMPRAIAQSLANLTYDYLPIDSLQEPRDEILGREEVELLLRALEVCDALVYDGAVKEDDLGIVEAGAELMWQIHRYALLNHGTEVVAAVDAKYELLLQTLNRPGTQDARKLTRLFAEHARTEDWQYPEIPDEIEAKIQRWP